MKKSIFIVTFTIYCLSFFAQTSKPDTTENLGLVKWMTIQEAQEAYKKQPKPILIDVYTNWCGWCKYMMKTTFSNPNIANYINTWYYPVKLNAETHDTIEYLGQKYINKSPNPKSSHDLAIKLLGGKMSYPSLVFLSNNYQFNLLVPGYQKEKDIEPILVYTVENVFQTTDINDFIKEWTFAFTDSLKKDTASVKWLSLSEGLSKQKEKPKKIMIFMNTSWCNSSKAMMFGTFKKKNISSMIEENFYPVYFDMQSTDMVLYKDKVYQFDQKGNVPFHQFAMAALNGKITIPSIVFLDENGNMISNVPYYLPEKLLNLILEYFGKDHYKTEKWDEFKNKSVELKK